jgi:anti-anti-sigma factor
VLAISGELDLLTEREFGAYLHVALACGRGSVELDLSQLNFLDASALRVIAQGAALLIADGRTLTIRSPGAGVVRAFDIAGLAELVRVEPASRFLIQIDSDTPDRLTALPGSCEPTNSGTGHVQ